MNPLPSSPEKLVHALGSEDSCTLQPFPRIYLCCMELEIELSF